MPLLIDGLGELTGLTVPLSVAQGGTGGSNAASAQNNLGGVPFLHHNDIINGDFRIAQAGTSFAAAASGAYDLDGWENGNASTAVFTVAQVAGSTAGRLARQATITTADAAVAIGDYVLDRSKIEGYNIEKYVGNTFTIAFRAKVPVVGIHCVALRNSGQDRSYVKEINFPTANAWQACSFTVTGGLPTAGTWNYTTGIGLDITFAHMVGTTFQTTADAWNTGNFFGTVNQVNDCATVGNVWAMEKVTLNLGTVAAVSEISLEQELIRCQRYFQRFIPLSIAGGLQTTTQGFFHIRLVTDMRVAPVATISGTFTVDDYYAVITSATALVTVGTSPISISLNLGPFAAAFGAAPRPLQIPPSNAGIVSAAARL